MERAADRPVYPRLVQAQRLAVNAYLVDSIGGIQAACKTAGDHLKDEDPTVVDTALQTAREFLNDVMAGKVEEWIS